MNQIKKIVDQQETVYQLSDFLKEKIENSRKQIKNGAFLKQQEMDLEIEKYFNEA